MKLISKLADQKRYPNPLLFIHGINGGSWVWEWNFLPYFSGLGYDTYAINLTGHYLEPPPPNFNRLGAYDFLKDVEEAVNRLASPIVIGHSAGGFLLQKYLERHTLKGAVLFASLGPNGMEKDILAWRTAQHLGTVLSNLVHRKPWFLYQTPQAIRQTMFCRHSVIADAEIQRIASLVRDESYRWVTELMFGLVKCHLPQNFITPIRVVAPQEDYFISPKAYDAIAQRYAADIHRVEKTGHAAQLDWTWKEVADGIHGWIQERVLRGSQGS